MNITVSTEKKALVERLIKEGHISIDEGLVLLSELPTVSIPFIQTEPYKYPTVYDPNELVWKFDYSPYSMGDFTIHSNTTTA